MLMMPPPPPRAQLRIESWFEGDGIGGDAVRLVRISNWFASRTYGRLLGMPRDEYCPLTRSLDLFGDRWGSSSSASCSGA
jgi:hypothetical protein